MRVSKNSTVIVMAGLGEVKGMEIEYCLYVLKGDEVQEVKVEGQRFFICEMNE